MTADAESAKHNSAASTNKILNFLDINRNFEFFVTSQIMFDLFCASYQVGAGNIAYSDCFILLGWGYIDR